MSLVLGCYHGTHPHLISKFMNEPRIASHSYTKEACMSTTIMDVCARHRDDGASFTYLYNNMDTKLWRCPVLLLIMPRTLSFLV